MTNTNTVTVSMAEPDIAWLTLDTPGRSANILSRSVLAEFDRHFDDLEKRSGLAGLVIRSAKPAIFVAGADIKEFAEAKNITPEETVALARRGQRLFARLSRMPFVTVAAIGGVCVGGGAELAIWCDRRIMTTDKAQFGFPEVKLGIIPGWGGTARTPRIIGLSNAVELITSGNPLSGKSAYAQGLASDLVPAERLDAAAAELIRAEQRSGTYLDDRRKWSQPIAMSETELGFLGATASAYIQQETKGHYPAPLAALEVMLAAAGDGVDAACEKEAEAFGALFGTPINRSLINVFFLTDRNKKDPGVAQLAAAPRAVRTLGVVGAGIMGSGIAAAAVKRELVVAITDSQPAALARGVSQALQDAAYDRETKKTDAAKALRLAPQLRVAGSDHDFAACDLVIEAVVENPDVKLEVYRRLEPLVASDAILASNTSAISIGRLAAGLSRPERFCGIHFFNPVRRMQLVEVIRGPQTSDATVASAVAFVKSIGKSPIVVEDGPGFLVNRLLLPYMAEALELLAEGVPIAAVDQAAKSFGMPMGPITLYDVVGLDTALYAGRVMHEAFPERMLESPILTALVEAGRLGQKSGAGFFSYAARPDRGQPDPALDSIWKPFVKPREAPRPDTIVDRLFLPMVLEATRILDEKKVRDPRDVDLGLIYGIGFPPFRGGLLFWADTLGVANVLERLRPLQSLGPRFRPTSRLTAMAASGAAFYDAALQES